MARKRGRRVTFKVSFELPPDATVSEAQAYVICAIQTERGCLLPYDDYIGYGDPMSELIPETVTVKRLRDPKEGRA